MRSSGVYNPLLCDSPNPSSPPFDSISSVMSSQATTPPETSAGSPRSPGSPESLHPPPCRQRDRSPSPMRGHLIPSPLITRRTRTVSQTALAAEGPTFGGVCKCFSRSKGHGFITPHEGGNDIFVHISDIEGEYVLMEGDVVSYKMCPMPPKNTTMQAVEVTITHLTPGSKHETWTGNVVRS